MTVSRRAIMLGLYSLAGPIWSTQHLARAAPAAMPSPVEASDTVWKSLPVTKHGWPARGALGCVPRQLLGSPAEQLPLVVMLHGYGQTKSVSRALHAWRDEYGLRRAYRRLKRPPLTPHFAHAGMLTPERSEQINAELARRPFRGCAAACPALPAAYPIETVGPAFAEWLRSDLLLSATRTLGTSQRREATGVAGMSMGALLALEVALRLPDEFSAVVGMQIDLDDRAARRFAERFDAVAQAQKPIFVFVLTSQWDTNRRSSELLYRELKRRGLPSEFRVTPGNHTAAWVYEVGCIEMLLWFDRWFRTSPSPPE